MGIKVNKVICGDCREVLKGFPNNSVDLTITSPPYNLGKSCRGKKVVDMYEDYEDNLDQKEYQCFMDETIGQLIRVTKWYTFFNFQMLTDNRIAYTNLMHKYKHNIKDVIVWVKRQVQPAIQPTCLSSAFEFVWVLTKPELAKKRTFERANFNNRKKLSEKNWNVIFGDSASKELNLTSNKAIFPEYFVRWFLNRFGQKGDIILDPFLGSGTTAYVAKTLGMYYVGIDLSKDYCEKAYNRLRQNTLI